MSAGVSKIFTVLIVVVACVLIGAFLLNILLPNVTATVVDAVEDMIYRATGMSFDFNNNGKAGGATAPVYQGGEGDSDGLGKDNVKGFK